MKYMLLEAWWHAHRASWWITVAGEYDSSCNPCSCTVWIIFVTLIWNGFWKALTNDVLQTMAVSRPINYSLSLFNVWKKKENSNWNFTLLSIMYSILCTHSLSQSSRLYVLVVHMRYMLFICYCVIVFFFFIFSVNHVELHPMYESCSIDKVYYYYIRSFVTYPISSTDLCVITLPVKIILCSFWTRAANVSHLYL